MGTRIVAISVALLTAGALTVAQTANSAWVAWLRANHAAITMNGVVAPDDFSDLQPLKQAIGTRRIVQIGESHHSVAEYHHLKTRLVKFLHEEMGFDVLAFESSIYECFAADLRTLSPAAAIGATIFPVWATEDMVPLFDYLKRSQSSERPLTFAGFDTQISAYGAVTTRPAFFRRVVGAVDTEYAERVAAFDAEFVERIRIEGPRYARAEEETLVAFYDRLAAFIAANRDRLNAAFPHDPTAFFAYRAAWSSARFVQQLRSYLDNPDDASMEGHFALRDQAMADNLTALARELYPDRKIIVWAANLHVRHANHETSYEFPTMGGWLVERFRNELYTIGVYPNRGQFAGGSRTVTALAPAPGGTMEHLMTMAGSSPLFVDLLGQERAAGNEWMFDTIMTREPQPIGPEVVALPIVPRDQYDGLLFFDRISAPTFLRGPG